MPAAARDAATLKAAYDRDGYVADLEILTPDEAAAHRTRLEAAEAEIGPLHYRAKAHTFLTSPWELATHPRVLDAVEAVLGPDILLYDAQYIVKEPRSPSHVSWHQDLTFWGLSDDAQVTLWLALSPATELSGCMRMVPGSHRMGVFEHRTGADADNVLLQGQTVEGVAEETAVMCPLAPGRASLHHGWTLHASLPNRSDDRRIGLNAQFLAPHVRQTKHDGDSAILVRGRDAYGHFAADIPAERDLDPAALARWEALNARQKATQGMG